VLAWTGRAGAGIAVAGLFSMVAAFLFPSARLPLTLAGAVLLAVVVATRLCDLRQRNGAGIPWSLTVIAMLLPPGQDRYYLGYLTAGVDRTRRGERRRHTWNAVTATPGTLVTLWGGWLRTGLVRLTIAALRDQVTEAKQAPPSPATRRRLRRCCRLIRLATGGRQYQVLTEAAQTLSLTCADAGADVRQETAALVTAMTEWRPDLS